MPGPTTEVKNQKLYDTLVARGYNPTTLGPNKFKPKIKDAKSFEFTFVKNGKSYGTARVAIYQDQVTLYTNERLDSSPESKSKNSDFDDSWDGFKEYLSKWARKNNMGFKLSNDDYYQSDMAKRDDMENKKLNEGYYPAGKKASYSDNVPQVKILIQHTRQIEEGEQRYRNVARIFVENTNGERFLLPTKRPGIAKVYARHIAEGGTPYDDKGTHITSLVEEYTKMAGFVRAVKNGQFNESAQRLVNEGIAHYEGLRHTLGSMISQRGYHKYFDNYTPVLNEETEDSNTLNELFVQETLDPRIESVLPILKKLSKNLNEMNEVKELEEWAQSINEESVLEHAIDPEIELQAVEMYREEGMKEKEIADSLGISLMQVHEILAAHELGEGKLGKALGAAAVGAMMMNPMAKAGGITLDQPGGFSAQDQTTLNQKVEKSQGVEALQKFLAKQGMKQIISGQLDNLTYDNIMKVSQMHDAGKLDSKAAAEFQQLAQGAGLTDVKEDFRYYYPGATKASIKKKAKNFKHGIKEGPADAPEHEDMDSDDKRWDDAEPGEEEVDEGLDANQKRAGQLGPTEPVGKNEKNLRGKLVGASESVELETIKMLSGIK